MKRSNILFNFFTLFILSLSYFIFSGFLIISIWFLIIYSLKILNIENKILKPHLTLYYATVFVFPMLESILTWLIKNNIIAYSWFWLNRIEHIIASASISILILLILFKYLKKVKWYINLILLIAIVSMIGNFVEFFQYIRRIFFNNSFTINKITFYSDTILDMFSNVLGSFLGFIIFFIFNKNKQ